MIARWSVSTFGLLGILATTAAPSLAQGLPPVVETAIQAAKAECSPDKPKLEPGFVESKDINADGVTDYILDYGRLKCGDAMSLYCGSAGCTTTVYASLPGGSYVVVLDDNVQALSFKTVKGKPAMILGLHGSACNKVGAAACDKILFWNGKTFKRGG